LEAVVTVEDPTIGRGTKIRAVPDLDGVGGTARNPRTFEGRRIGNGVPLDASRRRDGGESSGVVEPPNPVNRAGGDSEETEEQYEEVFTH
jgi:hypothetical protein